MTRRSFPSNNAVSPGYDLSCRVIFFRTRQNQPVVCDYVIKDRPILRAALNAGADLFLTGDKDFLESSVKDPRIISVPVFLEM